METQRTSALAPAGAQIARMRRLRRHAQRAERAFALRIKFAAIAAVAVYATAVSIYRAVPYIDHVLQYM